MKLQAPDKFEGKSGGNSRQEWLTFRSKYTSYAKQFGLSKYLQEVTQAPLRLASDYEEEEEPPGSPLAPDPFLNFPFYVAGQPYLFTTKTYRSTWFTIMTTLP